MDQMTSSTNFTLSILEYLDLMFFNLKIRIVFMVEKWNIIGILTNLICYVGSVIKLKFSYDGIKEASKN